MDFDREMQQGVQARLDQAEFALKLLAAGRHKYLERFLSGITSDIRVITDAKVLEQYHADSNSLNDALHVHSSPAGAIRASFVGGEFRLTVYSLDPEQAELLSLSQRELALAVFHAIGLTKPLRNLSPFPTE